MGENFKTSPISLSSPLHSPQRAMRNNAEMHWIQYGTVCAIKYRNMNTVYCNLLASCGTAAGESASASTPIGTLRPQHTAPGRERTTDRRAARRCPTTMLPRFSARPPGNHIDLQQCTVLSTPLTALTYSTQYNAGYTQRPTYSTLHPCTVKYRMARSWALTVKRQGPASRSP